MELNLTVEQAVRLKSLLQEHSGTDDIVRNLDLRLKNYPKNLSILFAVISERRDVSERWGMMNLGKAAVEHLRQYIWNNTFRSKNGEFLPEGVRNILFDVEKPPVFIEKVDNLIEDILMKQSVAAWGAATDLQKKLDEMLQKEYAHDITATLNDMEQKGLEWVRGRWRKKRNDRHE